MKTYVRLSRIKIYWKAKAQAANENDAALNDTNGLECLASFRCSIRQGFPLCDRKFDEDTCLLPLFVDDDENGDATVLLDLDRAYLSIELDECPPKSPSDQITFEEDINVGDTEKRKSLSDVVKSTISNVSLDESNIETGVYFWGDNACNCMVR